EHDQCPSGRYLGFRNAARIGQNSSASNRHNLTLTRMRPIQAWARKKRIKFFLPYIQSGQNVLEIGAGEGWFRDTVNQAMPVRYTTMDVESPADIQGDIRHWKQLQLSEASYDVIVAFEVVEHVDCFRECWELLKPGGRLLITTPMPHMD